MCLSGKLRLSIDASSLVAELPRARGKRIISLPEHELIVSEHAWSEVRHELPRRLAERERHGRLEPGGAAEVYQECLLVARRHIRVIPAWAYVSYESTARRRVPRDPRDWPTVALALALEAGIWTADADFLGCGVPTRTTETLLLDADA